MTPDEARAVAALTGRALAGLAGGTATTADALRRRLRGLRPADAPPRPGLPATVVGTVGSTADLVVGAVSATAQVVALGLPVAGAAAGAVTAAVVQGDASLRDGRAAGPVAVLAATAGHHPAVRDGALEIPLAVRQGGRDVAPGPAAIRAAFPDAAPLVAVWVHGLGETDRSWARGRGADRPVPFPRRLAADTGATPVLVRYNTGLRIEDNGARLADLLERTVADWPVPVTDLLVVGHSMGGLVAHAALRSGRASGLEWTRRVRLVVSLGSPHRGAPLARAARPAAGVLARLPETTPLSGALTGLSHGIHDLARGARRDPAPDAHHLLVAATVGGSAGGPLGSTVGDLLVPRPSAHDASGEPLTAARVTVARTHHQGLMSNDVVYAHLLRSAHAALG